MRVVSQTFEPERAVALGAQQVEAPCCALAWGLGVPTRLGDVPLLVGDVLELLGERAAVGEAVSLVGLVAVLIYDVC